MKELAEPETESAPADFVFSASQVVDRLLEVFNSDAPPAIRRAAIGDCCLEDGLEVAILTGDRRVTTSGHAAVDAVAAASDRVTRAEPRLRVFMEPGRSEDDNTPQKAEVPTLCLDVYAADETPGLSAVVKGKPMPTVVLYRAQSNHLTHAWIAPDRDGFAKDWQSVSEDGLLESKAMSQVNAVLADQLPKGYDFWDFHFHNYHPSHVPAI